jgi:predicted kinase
VLRDRIGRREREGKDASEAGLAVLKRQLAVQEPLGEDEAEHAFTIDSEQGMRSAGKVAETLALRLGLT